MTCRCARMPTLAPTTKISWILHPSLTMVIGNFTKCKYLTLDSHFVSFSTFFASVWIHTWKSLTGALLLVFNCDTIHTCIGAKTCGPPFTHRDSFNWLRRSHMTHSANWSTIESTLRVHWCYCDRSIMHEVAVVYHFSALKGTLICISLSGIASNETYIAGQVKSACVPGVLIQKRCSLCTKYTVQ